MQPEAPAEICRRLSRTPQPETFENDTLDLWFSSENPFPKIEDPNIAP